MFLRLFVNFAIFCRVCVIISDFLLLLMYTKSVFFFRHFVGHSKHSRSIFPILLHEIFTGIMLIVCAGLVI